MRFRRSALAAALGLLVAAPGASAATVRANITVQGAGSITGPQATCTSTDQNDRNTKDCGQQVVVNDPSPFGVGMTITAAPSSLPSGHWKFSGWQGCESVSGTNNATCNISAPGLQGKDWDVKAVFDDSVAPTIASGPTETYSSATERDVAFTFGYNEGVTAQCRVDSGAFADCSSGKDYILSEGDHTFDVRAFDASGNLSSTSSRGVKIVDTALISGPSGLVNTRAAHFGYTTVAGNAFECSLDGAAFGSCPVAGADYANLADGTHSFAVRARNGGFFDHIAATRSWTIDATAPDTTLDALQGPGEAAIVTALSATFGFASSESGSTFECSLDGAAFRPCTAPSAVNGLAAGAHVFRVRAIDRAGNVDPSPAQRSWTVAPPDADHDGYNAAQDCNDHDPKINPGAAEILDNDVDENCDGIVGVNLDRDGDGVQRPADCDDTDAAIKPGAVDVPDNGIDEDCSGADAHAPAVAAPATTPPPTPPPAVEVKGAEAERIPVTLAYFMVAHRASTRFTTLQVKTASTGTTVTVSCTGSGCPRGLKGKGYVKKNAPKTLSLKQFIKKPLKAGMTLTVTVTKPNAVGAMKVLKVRAAKKPLITTRCVQPGARSASAC